MQTEEMKRLAKSLDKEQFLELIYTVLVLHPQWVREVAKALNLAIKIKDEWVEEEHNP
jgi:hypothetical protein